MSVKAVDMHHKTLADAAKAFLKINYRNISLEIIIYY